MPTNYPDSLDNFTNPTPADQLSTPAVLHTDQHSNENDAIEALEKWVGISGSTESASIEYRVSHFTGTPGPQGPQGIPGPTGSQGIQGPSGSPGSIGPQGPAGTDGAGGVFVENYGVPVGTGTIFNFGNELQASISGSSVQVDVTGATMYLAVDGTRLITYSASGQFIVISNTPDPKDNIGVYILVTGTPLGTGTILDFVGFSVSLSGTVARIEVTGTIGATGPQGPSGSPGSQGPQGAEGATGSQGPIGPQGPSGSPGSQGLQGIQGPTGAQGIQGIQGLEGATGATGPQGIQGIQGPTGAIGPQGPQGLEGATGATGPQGIQGIQGPTGSQGIQGVQGPTGSQGPQGIQGPSGSPGSTGPTGPSGSPGSQGPAGTPLLGIMGQNKGTPLQTGTTLNVNGDRLVMTISGTVFNLSSTPEPIDNIGVMFQRNGVPLATGSTINVIGSLTVSGSVYQFRANKNYPLFISATPFNPTAATNLPANDTVFSSVPVELIGYSQAKLKARFGAAANATASGTLMHLTVSITGTSSAVEFATTPATKGFLRWIASTYQETGWFTFITGAALYENTVLFLQTTGGNGTADPNVWSVIAEFR